MPARIQCGASASVSPGLRTCRRRRVRRPAAHSHNMPRRPWSRRDPFVERLDAPIAPLVPAVRRRRLAFLLQGQAASRRMARGGGDDAVRALASERLEEEDPRRSPYRLRRRRGDSVRSRRRSSLTRPSRSASNTSLAGAGTTSPLLHRGLAGRSDRPSSRSPLEQRPKPPMARAAHGCQRRPADCLGSGTAPRPAANTSVSAPAAAPRGVASPLRPPSSARNGRLGARASESARAQAAAWTASLQGTPASAARSPRCVVDGYVIEGGPDSALVRSAGPCRWPIVWRRRAHPGFQREDIHRLRVRPRPPRAELPRARCAHGPTRLVPFRAQRLMS